MVKKRGELNPLFCKFSRNGLRGRNLRKRGLSPVVANVLIILLVIAAVAIIWAVVRPAIEGTGEKITETTECISLDLSVVSCSVSDIDNVVIAIKRGAGEVGLDVVRLVVDGSVYDSGTTPVTIVSGQPIPQELGTTTYGVVDTAVDFTSGATKVSVGGILDSGQVCDPPSLTVTCS
jgi:hypothetical protein